MKFIYGMLLICTPLSLLGAEKEYFDFNFDGHDDYRIWRESDGRLAYYDIYLYSEEKKEFVKHEGLSKLYNPVPKKDEKEIECFWPGGHSGLIYTAEVYEWKEDHLRFKHLVSQFPNSHKEVTLYVRLTTTVVDSKPRVDKVEYIDPELK